MPLKKIGTCDGQGVYIGDGEEVIRIVPSTPSGCSVVVRGHGGDTTFLYCTETSDQIEALIRRKASDEAEECCLGTPPEGGCCVATGGEDDVMRDIREILLGCCDEGEHEPEQVVQDDDEDIERSAEFLFNHGFLHFEGSERGIELEARISLDRDAVAMAAARSIVRAIMSLGDAEVVSS